MIPLVITIYYKIHSEACIEIDKITGATDFDGEIVFHMREDYSAVCFEHVPDRLYLNVWKTLCYIPSITNTSEPN